MPETVSTNTPEAQHVRPRFVPVRSNRGNPHIPSPPSSPPREVRTSSLPVAQKPKLLAQVREALRTRHYSLRTEKMYVHWIKRFIFFHHKRHPLEMGEAEIGQFLSSLARESHVSASTQNQALNALLFLYQAVLGQQIGYLEGVVRAKRPRRLPVVLTREEVGAILQHLEALRKPDLAKSMIWWTVGACFSSEGVRALVDGRTISEAVSLGSDGRAVGDLGSVDSAPANQPWRAPSPSGHAGSGQYAALSEPQGVPMGHAAT
jgi:hypothetical protein